MTEKPGGDEGGKETRRIEEHAQATAAEERNADGVDQEGRTWDVANTDQAGKLILCDLTSAAQRDSRFGADGKSAYKAHQQRAYAAARYAEQPFDWFFKQLAENFTAAADDQQLGDDHEGEKRGNYSLSAELQSLLHISIGCLCAPKHQDQAQKAQYHPCQAHSRGGRLTIG